MATGGSTSLLGTAGNANGPTIGASSLGDGQVLKTMYPIEAVSVQAEIQGSPTVCVINVLALLDGLTWDTIAVIDIGAGYLSGEMVPLQKPILAKQFKGNISALSGGSSPSVALYMAWRD